jgi:hypothetical protein
VGRFDPHPNTEPEPFGRVAFEEGHDGSVSIDESSKVGLVDFGNRLSHGVNHVCDKCRTPVQGGLLRFGLDYYLTVSREESS